MTFKKKQTIVRWAFYGLLAANILLAIWFWAQGSGGRLTGLADDITAVGRLSGILLAISVLYQFVLMGRFPILERYVGLQEQNCVHRFNGYAIFYLLLAHASLLTIGYSLNGHTNVIAQYLDFVLNYNDVLDSFLAQLILYAVIILSIQVVRKRLAYEWWYIIHLSVYVAVILAWGHQLKNGTDFIGHPAFALYWQLQYYGILGLVLLFRFIRPAALSLYYRLQVDRVVEEAEGTFSVYVKARNLPTTLYSAGQFAQWGFLSNQLWYEAHPFSFSTAPRQNTLRFTAKAVGDYTRKLANLKPGTPLWIDAPHGVFTLDVATRKKILFIAGGSGITPIRAMAEELGEWAKEAVLLYAARNPQAMALRGELDEIAATTGMRVKYIFAEGAGTNDIQGTVDAALIEAQVVDVNEREIYICGPPPMRAGIVKILQEKGLSDEQIHYEVFTYEARNT